MTVYEQGRARLAFRPERVLRDADDPALAGRWRLRVRADGAYARRRALRRHPFRADRRHAGQEARVRSGHARVLPRRYPRRAARRRLHAANELVLTYPSSPGTCSARWRSACTTAAPRRSSATFTALTPRLTPLTRFSGGMQAAGVGAYRRAFASNKGVGRPHRGCSGDVDSQASAYLRTARGFPRCSQSSRWHLPRRPRRRVLGNACRRLERRRDQQPLPDRLLPQALKNMPEDVTRRRQRRHQPRSPGPRGGAQPRRLRRETRTQPPVAAAVAADRELRHAARALRIACRPAPPGRRGRFYTQRKWRGAARLRAPND